MEHNSNLSFSAMQLEGLIDQGMNHTFSAHLTTNHSLCSRHLPRGGLEPEVIKTLMCFLTNQQDFFIETMLPYSCVAEMFTGLGYLTVPKFWSQGSYRPLAVNWFFQSCCPYRNKVYPTTQLLFTSHLGLWLSFRFLRKWKRAFWRTDLRSPYKL